MCLLWLYCNSEVCCSSYNCSFCKGANQTLYNSILHIVNENEDILKAAQLLSFELMNHLRGNGITVEHCRLCIGHEGIKRERMLGDGD